MKITDLRVLIHERRYPKGFPMPGDTTPLGVLTIVTDEGVEGHDFFGAPCPDVTDQLIKIVKPMLIGRDPLEIGAIWNELWGKRRALHATVQGYVDVALWDIAGKVAGLPVHRMLGSCRQSLPCYPSSWIHLDNGTYAEEAAAYSAQGFSAYKLHPPTQRRMMLGNDEVTIVDDIAACTMVREAVGDGYVVMLDAAWAYSYPEALTVGLAIQDLDYYWYEDPLQSDDLHGYTRLKQQLRIPIMATELTEGGLYALAPWVTAKATDFLRGDVVLKGGITGMMKIAHLAEAFHLNCEVHDAYNGLNNAATLNVVMAINNCEYFEVIAPHVPGSYDLDHFSYGLATPFAFDGGRIAAPTSSGLGVEPDWALLRSAVLAEL